MSKINEGPFTEREKYVMDLLVEAHNKFIELDETHPNENNEWVNNFHALQNVLAKRVLRRDYPNHFFTNKIK